MFYVLENAGYFQNKIGSFSLLLRDNFLLNS